jgi:tetratricopeptide (TPR) repeat protein
LQPLPGADDPRYVHGNAVWSPDGYLVFARAEARDPYPPGTKVAEFANDPNETQIRYDLYRIPFNGGKGGRAEPVEGASNNGRSNSFPKVSPDGKWIVFVQSRNGQLMRPDSELFIVPAVGGKPRRMTCNTPLMNSWHSFSPNGRWMVFSSKSRSPYTQMFLTHIDENGADTPAILIENSTASNRAVNLPEFLNIAPDGLLEIDAPVTELYRLVDTATELAKKGDQPGAIAAWEQALKLAPADASVHFNLANALSRTGDIQGAIAHYRKAIEASPDHAEAHNNLGYALASQGRAADAIEHFETALRSNPENANAHINLGNALAQQGRMAEAIPHFEAAVAYRPEDPQARTSLAVTLAMTGNPQAARPHLEKAAQLSPRSIEIQLLLGRVLASQSNFAGAIPHFERAATLSGGKDAAILDLLAGCYAQVGRIPDAVSTGRHALADAREQGNDDLARSLETRVAAYEAALAPK